MSVCLCLQFCLRTCITTNLFKQCIVSRELTERIISSSNFVQTVSLTQGMTRVNNLFNSSSSLLANKSYQVAQCSKELVATMNLIIFLLFLTLFVYVDMIDLVSLDLISSLVKNYQVLKLNIGNFFYVFPSITWIFFVRVEMMNLVYLVK